MKAEDYLKKYRIKDQLISQQQFVVNKKYLLSEMLEGYAQSQLEKVVEWLKYQPTEYIKYEPIETIINDYFNLNVKQ